MFRFALGFYVYKELLDMQTIQDYYGIPGTIGHNGTIADWDPSDSGIPYKTCLADHDADSSSNCRPMEKLFFLQYQWFPFYLAFVALFYYLPYILFNFINTDMESLKTSIGKQKCDVDEIVKNYFNMETNQPTRQMLKVVMNLVVKVLYLVSNILVLSFTDGLLNGRFSQFGSEWMAWAKREHVEQYKYMGVRGVHAGQRLLPVFGMCDVLELGQDIKFHVFNEYSLVCEISQHVLYHYVLFVIWFLIVIGFILSILGIIHLVLSHILRSRLFANEEIAAQRVYNTLSTRESEYLDFIRKTNVVAYGSIIRALHKQRFENPQHDQRPPRPTTPIKDSNF